MIAKRAKSIVLVLLTLVVIISSCVILCACDKGETKGDIAYGMYVKRFTYDADADTMTAYVAITNDESLKLAGAQANWHYDRTAENIFYDRYGYVVSFDPSTIFSVVESSLTQEQRIVDEVEYHNLKVVFEYATIYKSLEGGVEATKSGDNYIFDYPLNETDSSFEAPLSLRVQNTATWYGILVSAAILIVGIIITIVRVRRKKYGR